MSKSNSPEIEQGIGSETDHFVYRVPKKNHDAMMHLNRQFGDIIREYEVAHLIFQLSNTEEPGYYQHSQNRISRPRRGSLDRANIL
jgi:hypothetical protein